MSTFRASDIPSNNTATRNLAEFIDLLPPCPLIARARALSGSWEIERPGSATMAFRTNHPESVDCWQRWKWLCSPRLISPRLLMQSPSNASRQTRIWIGNLRPLSPTPTLSVLARNREGSHLHLSPAHPHAGGSQARDREGGHAASPCFPTRLLACRAEESHTILIYLSCFQTRLSHNKAIPNYALCTRGEGEPHHLDLSIMFPNEIITQRGVPQLRSLYARRRRVTPS